MNDTDHAVLLLYFDGVCGLCNRFVDFVIKRDHARHIRYATQQGPAFTALRQRFPEWHHIDSVVVVEEAAADEPIIYLRSAAILRILSELGGGWSAARFLRFIPAFIRDFFYHIIAKNRYALFGKKETCRLPTPAERALFLD